MKKTKTKKIEGGEIEGKKEDEDEDEDEVIETDGWQKMYEEQNKICWRLEKACTDLLTQTGRIVKENENCGAKC